MTEKHRQRFARATAAKRRNYDYLGAYDTAGIFLRGFKRLFDGSGTADLTEIVHLTDQMETIFLHLFDTHLDAAVDQIVNLKYKVMGKLPDPVPGVSFIALYSGFRDLDHQLDKVVETAAAADATFSLTDKFDVAAEISEAIKDKKSLEKSFPPTK